MVYRAGRYIRSQRLTWSSVLRKGKRLVLLDVANLTQGGTATEITNELDPALAALAVGAARQIGLRYCGVDVLTEDGTGPSSRRLIVELNGSPTIHHFAEQSRISERRLIDLHRDLLLAMARTTC
jgi:D-alanine-D-alanine ligase-like ATP-grasp enzyme